MNRFLIQLFLFFTLSLFVVLRLFNIDLDAMPIYRDEVVYIDCGLKYVSGTPPYLCNFEHPPLAKYLIGFSILIGFSRYLYVLMFVGSVLLVYSLCRRFGYSFAGFLCVFLLVFDTIYFNVFRFLLLDPVAVFFSLLALYLLFVDKFYLSAISMGLAIASKFSSTPIFFGVLYCVYRGKKFKGVLVYFFITLIIYLITYITDFSLGFNTVVNHHIDMLKYISWRHSFSLPIAVNGFLKLLTKVEFWHYLGDITIVLSNISGTYVVEETFIKMNRVFMVIGIGAGSPLWYQFFPALLYTTYLALVNRLDEKHKFITLFSWLSLLNIVAGPNDWYYVNTLPYLYMNSVIVLSNMFKCRWVGVCLIVIAGITFFATIFRLIPFKVVIVR